MSDTVLERLIYKLDAETSGFSDRIDEAQKTLGDFVEFVETKPALALGAAAAAMVALAATATKMAADVDVSFRKLEASLPDAGAGLGVLREEIVALSTVTPRTQEELAATAKAIANMGETNPQEIGKNLRTLALAADALGDADMSELADQLDLVGDAFGLSAEEARQAYVQIVALTKGKIDINDLAGAFDRSATTLKALGVGAVESAAAMTALIDAGVSKRQVVSGVLDLLTSASKAEDQALDAEAAKKEGTAQALRTLSTVMSKTNVESKGLLGAMAELYTALGENQDAFTKAGLSANQYAIAQKAANAVQDGAKVLSYAESVDKLSKAAEINRNNANALAQVLKNELAAQLIDLGNVFLPPVIKGLTILADLFGRTRAAAKNAAIEVGFANAAFAKGDKSVGVFRTNQFSQNLRSNPSVLDSDAFQSETTLRSAQSALVKSLNAPGYNGRPAVVGAARDEMIDALTKVATKLRDLKDAADAAAGGGDGGAGGGGLKDTGTAAAEAAEKLDAARAAATGLLDSLGDADAMTKATAQINAWAASAEKAKVPATEIANTVNVLREAFQRAADAESAKKVAEAVEDLTLGLRELQAESSGNAIEALDVAYERIIADLQKKATASEEAANAAKKLNDEESEAKLRATANGYRAQVEVATRRRDGLKDLAAMAERAAKAQETETRFTKAANAAYRDSVPTIADLRRAESDLLSVRTALQAIINDPKTDPAVRAEAQRLLATYTEKEAQHTAEIAEAVSAAAANTEELGNGIQRSALAALSLVQLLGQGNSELAQMLASVANIGSGISGLGAAASKAGGFGALFSSGSGIASALGPIGAIAGGVTSLIGVFGKQGEAARKRAEELRQAAQQFTDNLATFVQDIAEQDIGTFQSARVALSEKLGGLLRDAVKAAGFDSSVFRDNRASAASLRAYLDVINEQIARMNEEGNQATEGLVKLANSLGVLIAEADKAEEALRVRQAAELDAANANLRIRALAAQGRTEEADALRMQLDSQEELNEAIANFAGTEGYVAYIEALKAVQRAEAAAAEATRQRTAAISALNDTNDVLGGTAQQKLSRGLATFGSLFGELAGIADGLDLSTGGGLEALRAKLRATFTALLDGGITEAEQPIVDAIKALLGNIEEALGAIEDPFAEAVEAFGQMVSTFGLSLAEQATGYATLYGEKFGEFAALLGEGFDPTNTSGLEALRGKLRDAITGILADGTITDEEGPYLTALQNFFGLVQGLLDNAAAEVVNTRNRNADLDLALGDQTGAEAFATNLSRYSEGFRELFGSWDVTNLDQITSATDRLRFMREQIAGLSDADLMAQFGMTRDEFLEAILDVDSGLDTLGTSLTELAQQQGDFLNDLNVEFLEATGAGLDAVKLQTRLWVEQMIATAKALGVLTTEVETQIRTIGNTRIANAEQREKDRTSTTTTATSAEDRAARSAAFSGQFSRSNALQGESGNPNTIDGEITAQSVQSITAAQAMNFGDLLSSALVEQRGTRIAAEQIASMLATVSGITLRAPSLPQAGGGMSATVQIVVNVNGPIMGQTASEAGAMVAEAALPYLNEALARAAGVEARLSGGSLA